MKGSLRISICVSSFHWPRGLVHRTVIFPEVYGGCRNSYGLVIFTRDSYENFSQQGSSFAKLTLQYRIDEMKFKLFDSNENFTKILCLKK